MSQAVQAVQTMTSLEIVEMINKERAALFANGQASKYVELRHDNFMTKVLTVLGEDGARNFTGSYFSQQNKEYPLQVARPAPYG